MNGVHLGKILRDKMADGRNGKTLGELKEDLGLRYVKWKQRLEKVDLDWGPLIR